MNSLGIRCFLRVPMPGLRFSARGQGFRETFRVPRELQNELVNLDSPCPDSLTHFAAPAEREKFHEIPARGQKT